VQILRIRRDLARASNTTPQAMNTVLVTLEREGFIERHPHPTHGRILQVRLTEEGERRLEAYPAVRGLETAIEEGFTAEEIAAVKRWLVIGRRTARADRRRPVSASTWEGSAVRDVFFL
jgi:DNA-binding MarR family transcriptional regulator